MVPPLRCLHTIEEALPMGKNKTAGPVRLTLKVKHSHSHNSLMVKARLRASLDSKGGKKIPPLGWKNKFG